jgi:predicted RNA-binding protein with PUA-like domain
MVVTEGPVADPASDDPKAVVVKVKAVKRWPKAVTLAQIKQEPAFADWALVKNSRLSVMPVSVELWNRLEAMGRGTA